MQNETLLLISIFQEAYPLSSMRVSPEEYRDLFGFEIDRMGRILKYLGLAQGGRSDLCWKPTPILMKIIAERVAHPPEKKECAEATGDERSAVRLFMMTATGDPPEEHPHATEFCYSVLVALGLLTEGASGEYKPTDRLHNVMLHASLQQPVEADRT